MVNQLIELAYFSDKLLGGKETLQPGIVALQGAMGVSLNTSLGSPRCY